MSEAGSLSERHGCCYLGCGRSSEAVWPGGRIKYGTVLGLAQDREDVAERKKGKSLFDATAGHPYVTASEVQTSRARRRKRRGCYRTDKSRRGEKNKAQGRSAVLVLVVVLRTAALLARDLTRLTLCHC